MNEPAIQDLIHNRRKVQDLHKKLVEAILRYYWEPAAFVREVIGAVPDPWQEEVLSALPYQPRIAIAGCHDAGKDALAAWIILWFLTTRDFPKVPCTAPSAHQMHDVLWAECHKWMRKSHCLNAILEWKHYRIEMRGHGEEWFAAARVAQQKISHETGEKQAESISGMHAKDLLYVLDEASGIDEAIWDGIEGSLLSEGSRVLAIGNPLRGAGRFYDIFNKPEYRLLWWLKNVSFEECFRVDHGTARKMVQIHGEKSTYVRVRLLGQFPLPGTMPNAAVPWEIIIAARDREVFVGELDLVQIGVDVARFGDDETVYVVRKGPRVLKVLCEPWTEGPDIVGRIVELAEKYRDASAAQPSIVVDETGMGGLGVVDPLRRVKTAVFPDGLKVAGVTFSSKAKDTEKYANRISEIWLEDAHAALSYCRLDPDETLLRQLANRRYRFTGKGKQRIIESKDDLKGRGLQSPDRAEAFFLAFAREGWEVASAPAVMGRVDAGSSTYVPLIRPMSSGL